MVSHVHIKKFGWINVIRLINIIVDGASLITGVIRYCKAVICEPGVPEPGPSISRHPLHQVDLIDPARVTHLFDRPKKHTLRAILLWLRSQEDPHGRLWTWRYPRLNTQNDAIRLTVFLILRQTVHYHAFNHALSGLRGCSSPNTCQLQAETRLDHNNQARLFMAQPGGSKVHKQ